jgi:nucleotide-binding universal stress UspA family protein
MADSPGWALVAKAWTWKAHLVVVGAHSRTIFERFFFGSTASKVAMEAPSSVRIARPRQRSHERKPRIILAMDSSRDSELAMHAVASRKWPLTTEIRVLTVLNSKLETAMASPGSFARHWAQNHVEGTKEWISAMAVNFARHLSEGGQSAEAHIFEGDPKKVLLREAESWEADCIFLGARGLNHGERWLLGSVASAVASRAHCSVEIVRPNS